MFIPMKINWQCRFILPTRFDVSFRCDMLIISVPIHGSIDVSTTIIRSQLKFVPTLTVHFDRRLRPGQLRRPLFSYSSLSETLAGFVHVVALLGAVSQSGHSMDLFCFVLFHPPCSEILERVFVYLTRECISVTIAGFIALQIEQNRSKIAIFAPAFLVCGEGHLLLHVVLLSK